MYNGFFERGRGVENGWQSAILVRIEHCPVLSRHHAEHFLPPFS
jgi:hypothetical protein